MIKLKSNMHFQIRMSKESQKEEIGMYSQSGAGQDYRKCYLISTPLPLLPEKIQAVFFQLNLLR